MVIDSMTYIKDLKDKFKTSTLSYGILNVIIFLLFYCLCTFVGLSQQVLYVSLFMPLHNEFTKNQKCISSDCKLCLRMIEQLVWLWWTAVYIFFSFLGLKWLYRVSVLYFVTILLLLDYIKLYILA